MRGRWLLIAPFAIVGMVLFTFIGGTIVQVLWNWLLPPLFGWHTLTFWQALGLLILCRLLFGGLGIRGPGRSGFRRRFEESREPMSPERRERIRQRVRDLVRDFLGYEPTGGEGKRETT